MSYQNINQYVYRRWYLKPLNEVSDISLASDEKDYDQEVIFSPLLIGAGDGNRMPISFDFNSTGTTTCINCGDFDTDVIVSENYWNPLDLDLINCGKITSICDVGITGIDNGLVKRFSGETIYLNSGLYTSSSDRFSRYKYDRRLKMHPITGFTTTENRILDDNSYDYLISEKNDGNTVGTYVSFSGGFYQGFYKSFGYDYQVLPERFHLGWGSEFLLRYRWTGDTSVGLNARYPENKGIFFYYGTRAENKFYHYANGSPISDTGYTRVTQGLNCLETCGCSSSAATASTCHYVYQQSGITSQNCSCGQCPCNCTTHASVPELNPLYDGVSNALSLRLSGDSGSPRLCVKTFRITGGCETTGTCTTGITYTTGTSVTEWCSTRGIFDDCSGTTYSEQERWVQINAVFERNTYLDDCDLLYKGGLGEIVKTVYTASSANNSISLIEPPLTHEKDYDPATVEVVNITERWVDEKNDRLGAFKFYVNGKLFLVIENFEEIIPRPLNTSRETQIGVAYNMSLGGGTQGLHDNLTVTGCSDSLSGMTYQQDPECLTTEDLDETEYSGLTTHIRLEKYFGGSFFGDISAFRFYTEPLNGGQIRHNFKLLKEKYALLDPFCLKCDSDFYPVNITPTPTPTPTITETPTVTPTENLTTTPTPTITETPTVTPTENLTTTPTPTITETPTQTPTISQTESLTPTPTPTTPDSNFLLQENYSMILQQDGFGILIQVASPSPTPTTTETPTPTNTPTNTTTPIETPTNTPTTSVTETPTQTQTNTETPTLTNTPTTSLTETPTQTPTPSVTETPTNTPTNTPTPSVTPEPVTGYSFNLVVLPYNFPTTGNTIMNATFPSQTGTTNPNELTLNQRGIYFNSIDSDGVDRTSYFSQFTGQSITITMTQTGSTAIYSGDTNAFKYWSANTGTPPGVPGRGFVFGTNISVPGLTAGTGNAVIIQSASTNWVTGQTVYISAVNNSPSVTPTSTSTPTNTPTNTTTPTETPTNTPTTSVTETPTPTTTSTPTSTSTAPVTSNLVLYYDPSNSSSYSGSGTVINDLSGNGLNGTMSNITFTSPYFSYNGSTSQVSVADNALLEPGSGDWSIEFWVNHSVIAGSSRILIAKTDGGLSADWGYGLRTISNGSTFMEIGNGSTSITTPTSTLSINTWYQVVGVWTNVASNSLSLYINGSLIGSNSHSFTSIKNTTSPLYLGSFNGGQFAQWFNGRMGVVRMYNKSLTGSEVLQNYNADKSKYGL